MSETYIVVNGSQQTFYFDEKTLFEHLNYRLGKSAEFTFLKGFPLPNSNTLIDSHLGKDNKGRNFGRFCPFGDERSWPTNALLILRMSDGTIFVPEKVTVTKIVEEYGIVSNSTDSPDTIKVTKSVAKKVKEIIPSKKASTKRRTR